MQPMKKQSFLQGAGILAIATIIVKVIGAFYKIPLVNIIGPTGTAYFNKAYYIKKWLDSQIFPHFGCFFMLFGNVFVGFLRVFSLI